MRWTERGTGKSVHPAASGHVHWDEGYCHAPQNIYTDDSTGSRRNGRCTEKQCDRAGTERGRPKRIRPERAGRNIGVAKVPGAGRAAIYSARRSRGRQAFRRELYNAVARIGLEWGCRDSASAGDANGDCNAQARRIRGRCGSGCECRAWIC
jgi:hypothetical protein